MFAVFLVCAALRFTLGKYVRSSDIYLIFYTMQTNLRALVRHFNFRGIDWLIFCVLYAGNCNSGDELQVSVDVNYSAPGGFFLKPPYYRAASSLTLTCKVEGLQGALTYNWTSDCTGGCFTQGRTTQSVEKLALQSTDSGFHTCTVTDPGGCTGNATIEVKVVGE